MKINAKILSIPPYISTAWKHIASLHVEHQDNMLILVATLQSGAVIQIPNLEPLFIEEIFHTHARVIEQEEKLPPARPTQLQTQMNSSGGHEQIISFGFPFQGPPPPSLAGLDNFGSLLQHNPEQSESPDLPESILNKISHLAKTIGVEDTNSIPQPEENCNCTHCQIARALHKGIAPEESSSPEIEEIVSDEELRFKTWEISQTNDKLYLVSNPIDANEHYSVYLGEPVGCTCGEKHCDHIRAVLSS